MSVDPTKVLKGPYLGKSILTTVKRGDRSERLPGGALAGDAESLLERLAVEEALDGSAWRVCVGVLCL